MEAIYKDYSRAMSNSFKSKAVESKSTKKSPSQSGQGLAQTAKLAKGYVEAGNSVPDNPENRRKIELALKALEAARPSRNSRYQIHINAENKKLQLQLINHETGEVIEEIPSQRLLDFYSALEELNGFFVEKKA